MNTEVENKDRKKIVTLVAVIITLMLSVTSATYAFFALGASNNVIAGTSAKIDKELAVSQEKPSGSSNQPTK